MTLLTPDELEAALRDIGARRYHRLHPFHKLLHGGKCTKGQVQAWALNRYYYQSMIPIKDASLIARCDDSAIRREWRSRLVDHDGEGAGDGGIARWLKLTDGLGLDRDYVTSLRGLLPATRFAVDAYVRFVREKTLLEAIASSLTELFSPQIISERMDGMLASYPFVTARDARLFRQAAAAGRSAIPISRSTTASTTPARRNSSSRCWRRWNSNAACCGRCAMRCSTPMSIPKKYRPALSRRAADFFARSCALLRLFVHLAHDRPPQLLLAVDELAGLRRREVARVGAERWNFSSTSGMATTLRRSALTFWMIASGTPAGAISTIQPLDTTPGTVSLIAGRSGRLGRRLIAATPSSANAAALDSGREAGEALEHDRDAAGDDVVERHRAARGMDERDVGLRTCRGTVRRSDAPVRRGWWRRTACRPSILLASAISSATLLAGTSLFTATAIGCSPIMPIGANVFIRSNGILPSCWTGRTL